MRPLKKRTRPGTSGLGMRLAGSLSSHSPCVMRQAWGEGGGRCFLSACQAPPRHSRHQPPARQLQRSTSNKQPSPPRPATPRHPSPHLALHVIVKVGGLKEGPRQQVACRKQVGEELEGGGQLAQALARRILLQLRRCLAAVLVAAGRGTGGQEWATEKRRGCNLNDGTCIDAQCKQWRIRTSRRTRPLPSPT